MSDHVVTYFSWGSALQSDIPPPDKKTPWRMIASHIDPPRNGLPWRIVCVWERLRSTSTSKAAKNPEHAECSECGCGLFRTHTLIARGTYAELRLECSDCGAPSSFAVSFTMKVDPTITGGLKI